MEVSFSLFCFAVVLNVDHFYSECVETTGNVE